MSLSVHVSATFPGTRRDVNMPTLAWHLCSLRSRWLMLLEDPMLSCWRSRPCWDGNVFRDLQWESLRVCMMSHDSCRLCNYIVTISFAWLFQTMTHKYTYICHNVVRLKMTKIKYELVALEERVKLWCHKSGVASLLATNQLVWSLRSIYVTICWSP